MLIAKLRISIKEAGIAYNSSSELGTDKTRGTTLEDGKVIRGLGTHFASKEAKERYDKLVSDSNAIRDKFNRRFLRTPIESTFVISRKGEAKEFVTQDLCANPDIEVMVFEFELGTANGELDDREMQDWSRRVKEQLKRVPLGRGQDTDDEGLAALETLASCPVLSKETAERIRVMVGEVKVGKMNRTELKRGISLLDVAMDQTSLCAPRSRPEVVS